MGKIPTGTWVIVADGGKARMLHNVGGEGNALSLKQDQVLDAQDMQVEGPSGHQPPETSGSYIDEATFAKQLAHRLNAAALKNEFSHIILVADPQTLGQIRPQLHQEVTQRMVGELAKTFTNSPLSDIERALQSDE
ncbi:MAG: host attachment family protein [Rhodanobacter sp.]